MPLKEKNKKQARIAHGLEKPEPELPIDRFIFHEIEVRNIIFFFNNINNQKDLKFLKGKQVRF